VSAPAFSGVFVLSPALLNMGLREEDDIFLSGFGASVPIAPVWFFVSSRPRKKSPPLLRFFFL